MIASIIINLEQARRHYHIALGQPQISYQNILTARETMAEKRLLASATKRTTTDLTCLILTLVFTLAFLIAGLYSYLRGSAHKLEVPHDPEGKGCGLDYPGHSYIYFPSPQYDSLYITTCVVECPSTAQSPLDCVPNSLVNSCHADNSADNTRAFHIYPTFVYRGTVCLPLEQSIREKVLLGISAPQVEEIFGSVIKDWSLFLITVPIVVLMALLAVLLIRLTVGYVIYFFYLGAVAAFLGFGIFLLLPSSGQETFVLKKIKPVAIAASVLCFVLASVILCVFVSYHQKIKAAVQLIEKANQFLRQNPSLLLVPAILTAVLLLMLYYWIFLTFAFYSLSSQAGSDRQLPFQHYPLTQPVMAALSLNLFALIWTIFFLIHSGNYLVSSCLVNWQLCRPNSLSSTAHNFLAHIGSVCLRSFLTVLLGGFQILAGRGRRNSESRYRSQREREGESENENRCVDCLKRCYGCFCCFCITFLFRCFHHAAFSYQHLTGLPYCQASYQTYELIRNDRDKWSLVAFLYLIFDQFLPVAFAVINLLIANVLVSAIDLYKDNTSNRLLLFLLVALTSYAVSQFFTGLYSETIQALFVVYEFRAQLPPDQEGREGGPQSPRYSLFPPKNKT